MNCPTYDWEIDTGLFDRKPSESQVLQSGGVLQTNIGYSLDKNFLWVWGLKRERSDKLFIEKINLLTGQVVHEGEILLEKINSAKMIFSSDKAHIESIGMSLYRNEMLVTDPKTSAWSIFSFNTDQDNGYFSYEVLSEKVLIRGSFTTVNGEPSPAFFLVDPKTGVITRNNLVLQNSTFYRDDSFDGSCTFNIAAPSIYSFVFLNGVIYISGDFDHVNGQLRYGIAALDEDLNLLNFNPLPTTFSPTPGTVDENTCVYSGLGFYRPNLSGGFLTGPNNETLVTTTSNLLVTNGSTSNGSFLLNSNTGQRLGLLATTFTKDNSQVVDGKYLTIKNGISDYSFFDTVTNIFKSSWSLPTQQMNPNNQPIIYQNFETYKDYIIVSNVIQAGHSIQRLVAFKVNSLGIVHFKDLSSFIPTQTDRVEGLCTLYDSTPVAPQVPCLRTSFKIIGNSLIISTEIDMKSYSLSEMGID
jgi:hypothetical protein